ncbi:hypothetical protein [Amphibacillus marinus]|nr:hypothetical protein [Amphibacillus marinus]
MRKDLLDDLEDYFSVTISELDQHYEVISFLAISPAQGIHTLDYYLDEDITEVTMLNSQEDALYYFINQLSSAKETYISPTPVHSKVNRTYLYRLEQPVNVKYSVSCGLGIVRERFKQRNYFLYSINPSYRNEPERVEELIPDFLRLKLYCQLVNGHMQIDKRLRKQWRENKQLLISFLFANHEEVIAELEDIFK